MSEIRSIRKPDALRVPPHSIDAEQSVLGGLMLAPEKLVEMADWLSDGDFYRRDHALIYRSIRELVEANKPADAVTLGDWFEEQGIAELVGGVSYISGIANSTPSAANVIAYAEIVREKSALRQLIDIGTELAGDAFVAQGRGSRDLAAVAAAKLIESSGAARARGGRSMQDVGRSWFAQFCARMEAKGLAGVPTPWGQFNDMTGGLQADQLIIVAGRPGMGKSTWFLNACVAAALSGKRQLVFSLEMSAEQLYARAACALENIDMRFLREPDDADEETLARLSRAVATLRNAPIVIDDTPGLTHQAITLRAKREHMRSPLSGIWTDHIHQMSIPGKFKESTEYGDITKAHKHLAKSLGIPVVALAQLNRSVESRVNKRPVIADLRESGSIEQDADVIVFLYRDDYYAEMEDRASEHPGIVEMIIAKGRDIETGTIYARWIGKHSRIDHMDSQPERVKRGGRGNGSRGGVKKGESAAEYRKARGE